jgi:Phage derived protein Gp49-like (DUF891)
MVLLLSAKHGGARAVAGEACMLLRGWDENIKIDGHLKRASEDQPLLREARQTTKLPMRAVAAKVPELRVRGEDGIDRVFYYTAAPQGVIVFHAFFKKTRRTPPLEIELGRKRLKELLLA